MAGKTLSFFLKLNDKEFQSGLRKNIQSLGKFSKKMKRTGQSLSQNLTLPLAALGVTSIKLASDFEETEAKFNQVFSSIQREANKTAKTLQNDFGLSSKASMQLLGDTGDLLVGFGFTEKAALGLSEKVNKLAIDLASFTNFEGGATGASKALTKALVGETESAKALGIVIRQNTTEYKNQVKQIMATQGVSELQAKAIANLNIAYEQSGKAIGDFGRTSGSFANQTRILLADLESLGVEIGQVLLPIAQKGIQFFKGLVNGFRNLSPEVKENTVVFGILAAAVGPLLVVFGSIATTVAALGIKFVAISAAIAALALGVLYLVDNWDAFKERFSDIGWWKNALISMLQFLIEFNPISQIIKGFNSILDFFNKETLPNPFEKMADGLEELKVDTKDYETDFQDFGTFIESQAGKIKNALSGIGDAIGTGSGAGGGEESAFDVKNFIGNITDFNFRVTPIVEPEAFSLLVKTKEEINALNEAALKLAETQKQVSSSFESAFHSMAVSADSSYEDIGKAAANAARQVIKAAIGQAVASFIADSFAKMGIFGAVLAAGAGSIVGSLFNKMIPPFAEGGLVTGATLGIVGEGPGTSAINPEVIAPLDKLQGMLADSGGGRTEVFGRISGSDILLSSDRAKGNRNRTRGY
jgi:uncharacterized membrane protein YvlD (DUF360 family)